MKKIILIASLFATLILLVPMVSAVEINSEVEPLDEYTEKISYIWGWALHLNRTGLFRVNLTDGDINIISYTTNGFYSKNTDHVYMNFFIGFYPSGGYPVGYRFFGIAFGNIEW